MRRTINLILMMAVLTLGLLVAISAETGKQVPKKPAGGVGINLKKEEIPKLIEIIWIWKLVDELQLEEEQLTQFISRFDDLNDLKGKYYKNRHASINEMSKLLKANASDSELKLLTDKFKNIEIEFRQKERKLGELLNSDLTVKQRARFIVFQNEYRNDMRRLVKNLRELSDLREQPHKPQSKLLKEKK